MNWIKKIVRWLCGDYALYKIYFRDLSDVSLDKEVASVDFVQLVDASELTESSYNEIRSLAAYAAPDARCFAIRCDGDIAAACWYWYGDTYLKRNFWPLKSGEAKLIQLTTAERYRGKGYGTLLLEYSAERMKKQGFTRIWGRIWHSNLPSIRAVEKAGWQYMAFVAEVCPFGINKKIRVVRPR